MRCRECSNEYDDKLRKCPECEEPNPTYNKNIKRDEDDDEGDEGGILGQLGDIIGKIFGG